MTVLSDDTLLKRWYRQRDAEAFALIVARYGRMVYVTCRRILNSQEEAEDVAQDCFLRLATSETRGNYLGPLLHKMATHRALDSRRGTRRRRRREGIFAQQTEDKSDSDWRNVETNIDEAIDALPDDVRLPLVRHFLEGASYSELAETLNVPRSTVARRVQDGVAQIRSALQNCGFTATDAGCIALLSRATEGMLPATLAARLGKIALSGGMPGAAPIITGGTLIMAKKIAATVIIVGVCAAGYLLTPQLHFLQREQAAVPVSSSAPVEKNAGPKPVRLDVSGYPAPPEPAKPQSKAQMAKATSAAELPSDWMAKLAEALRKDDSAPESEGIKSSDLPMDNGMHFFLLAAELWPKIDEDRLIELVRQLRAGLPIDREELAALLEKCRPSLEAIRQGLETGNCQLPAMSGPDEPLPYLSKFRAMGRLMNLNAQIMALSGDYAGALDEYNTLLSFANESSRGACIINSLVSNAIVNNASGDIRNMLADPNLPLEMRHEFLQQLQALNENLVPFADTVNSEVSAFTNWYENKLIDQDRLRAVLTNPELVADAAMRQTAAQLTNEQMESYIGEFLSDYRVLATQLALPYNEYQQVDVQEIAGTNVFSAAILQGLENLPASVAHASAERLGTTLAVALELYHAEQGQYPDSLDALAPNFLSSVPKDPFTSQSFLYHPTSDGYALYSAGANMRDDGGASDDWQGEGDLMISD